MIYYTVFGIDELGQAYSSSNETQNWTLRGVRQGSHCFGLCEMSNYDGERNRLAVLYSWNPTDGYQYDPLGDVARAYDAPSAEPLGCDPDEEEVVSSPNPW